MFLDLKRQALKEVNFSIDIPENSEIHLESRYSFNIDYDQSMTQCIATLTHETRDSETHEKFKLFVRLNGFFECRGVSDGRSKQEAHLQAYTLLFPYAQSIIANLTMSAGLPPLMISRDDFTLDSVNVR